MHSSRMRTVRSSGRISGGSALGGCLLPEEGVCSREVSALGGVCSRGMQGCLLGGCPLLGGCLLQGVSALGRVPALVGGGCLLQGVSALGGLLLLLGGVCSRGGGIPACTEADTPTPPPMWTVERQTPVKT